MPRILIVDDDTAVARALASALKEAAFDVRWTSRGATALQLVGSKPPNLVVMDPALADLPGGELCRILKADSKTRALPIVIVSAKNDERSRVAALELGADDFVSKPFSVRELVLRVRAVLRNSAVERVSVPEKLSFGALSIDRAAHRVRVDGREVTLTALEFRLLTTLADRRSSVQPRESLMKAVWGPSHRSDPRCVDHAVERLRTKLGSASSSIRAVRGLGYLFVMSAPQPAAPQEPGP